MLFNNLKFIISEFTGFEQNFFRCADLADVVHRTGLKNEFDFSGRQPKQFCQHPAESAHALYMSGSTFIFELCSNNQAVDCLQMCFSQQTLCVNHSLKRLTQRSRAIGDSLFKLAFIPFECIVRFLDLK